MSHIFASLDLIYLDVLRAQLSIGFTVALFTYTGALVSFHVIEHHHVTSVKGTHIIWSSLAVVLVAYVVEVSVAVSEVTALAHEELHRVLMIGIRQYLGDISWQARFNTMHQELHCCGVDDFEDWLEKTWIPLEMLKDSFIEKGKMAGEQPTLAVKVRNAYKRYTPTAIILKGLNMEVPEGSIYGLLGPSGCGKTTLLSCIVGQRRLDAGAISVLVKRKVEIGFMPQEISLNSEFTISEVFHFYGRIYGMDVDKIESRGNDLVKFLELPGMSRIVGNCSGGQQRRISMAVTLLHDPKLLILDEPTVGVDPLLCHNIWEYFLKIVREQRKTIIITTHYIEEARNANLIGLMRGGILLAEEPPNNLLQQYHCDSLEEVFLKLSERQENNDEEAIKSYPKKQKVQLPIKNEGMFKKERFMAQLIKSWNWTKRNWTITMFVICLPALLFSILGQLATHDGGDYPVGDVPMAVVNMEIDDCTNTTVTVKLRKSCPPMRPISCRFLDHISQVINLDYYSTYEAAMDAVKQSQAFGIILIKQNFSVYMMERLTEQTGMSEMALEGSTVEVTFDMTDFGKGVRSTRELGQRIIDILQDVSQDCGYHREMADIPMEIVEYIYEVRQILQSVLPPYFSAVAFYTTMMYTSTAVIMERSSGLFERSQVAGLTTLEIILSQAVIQFGVMIIQNILSFFILYVVDGYTMLGSMPLCFFLIVLVQLSGLAYGLLLSVLIKVEKNVAYAGIFTVLSLFMLTGSLWPTEAIHWLLKPFSQIIPVTYTAESYYNISLRGWTISHYGVYIGIISSFVGIIVFLVLTYVIVTVGYGSFA